MGLVFGLVMFGVILLGIPVFILVASTESVALIVLTVVAFVLVLVLIGLINSTLNGIYIAAVYRYAAEGDAGGFFSQEMVEGAFRQE
jgi:hypothetical protein